MKRPTVLPTAQFAVWARRHAVRLPYPIDITAVPGSGVAQPDPELPALLKLAGVAAEPRVSAFALRAQPSGATDCYVALGADREAVLVTVVGETTSIVTVGETELALGVVSSLPPLAGFPLAPAELAEQEWNGLFELVQRGAEVDAILEHFAAVGLPQDLAEAMVQAVQSPATVGVLGASAWVGEREQLGPRLVAWHEYPDGAVLAEREPARGRTAPVIRVGPFASAAALRALAAAVGEAVGASAGPA